jgi:3-oxoacyl-[acyl-carrier protein] reductase
MVAVVTGSSRSTGAAIAKCLGEHGANVVVNYVNDTSAAEEVVKVIRSQGKGGAIAVKADASNVEGGKVILDEAVKTFGRVDILVLNTGIMEGKTLENLDEATFNAQFHINVKAPLFLVKAAAPLLPSRMLILPVWVVVLTPGNSWWPNHLLFVDLDGLIM